MRITEENSNRDVSKKASSTVCAVVVAYNRKNLLLECLESLRKQTKPVEAVYV